MEWIGDINAVINSNGQETLINYKDCKIKITKPRNIGKHNLAFACLGYTLTNMTPKPSVYTVDRLLLVFKDYEGMFEVIPRKCGDGIREYKSISFTSMDETEFEEVFQKILDFCCLVLGDRPKEVTDGLLEIIYSRR
jgi:hypothetical protein